MGGGECEVAVAADGLRGRRSFATTNWTLVTQAGEAGTAEGTAALEELCRTYWTPLYSFARRQGLNAADAEDLTQGFFEDLLARGAIARADVKRGRFRTFLLASFKHFQAHQRAAAAREKRGGGKTIVSLEALEEAGAQFEAEALADDSPEECFDRRWAVRLLDQVLATVRFEYERDGNSALFEALKTKLWGGGDGIGYATIGQGLGMTESAIKSAVFRLRRRFGERLRAEVAKTVLEPEDVDDEIRYLLMRVGG